MKIHHYPRLGFPRRGGSSFSLHVTLSERSRAASQLLQWGSPTSPRLRAVCRASLYAAPRSLGKAWLSTRTLVPRRRYLCTYLQHARDTRFAM